MNKVILCEGMTDAILLSYYLNKAVGWKFCRKPPKDIAIKEELYESLNWYEKGEDRLLICGVGGKDKMPAFFRNKIARPVIDADAFSRMAIVLDRDDKKIESIEAHASSAFKPIVGSMVHNRWVGNRYTNAFGIEKDLEVLRKCFEKLIEI